MNFLPPRRRRALKRFYLARFFVVCALVLSVVLVAHAVLMLPTYMQLNAAAEDRNIVFSMLEHSISGEDNQKIQSRIESVKKRSEKLNQTLAQGSASDAIRLVTQVPHTGITLQEFAFARGDTATTSRMAVTGIATSREALRTYLDVLSKTNGVSSATVPIGVYAKETDIGFTVSLVGKFIP